MKQNTFTSPKLMQSIKSILAVLPLAITLVLSGGCETTKVDKPAPVVTGGKIGVGTWATRAEFKDVRIMGPDGEVFAIDIPEDMSGWETKRGSWEVVDGALRQTTLWDDTRAVITGNLPWSNYAINLKARKLGGREGFLILFGMPSADSNIHSWWNLGGWGNTEHAIQTPGVPEKRVRGSIEEDHWYDVLIVIHDSKIDAYLDGELVQSVDGSVPHG